MHDPFLGQDVKVSNRLLDRLRGRYACGPTLANGEPEFGWNIFPATAVMLEAAIEIERLQTLIKDAVEVLQKESTSAPVLEILKTGLPQ